MCLTFVRRRLQYVHYLLYGMIRMLMEIPEIADQPAGGPDGQSAVRLRRTTGWRGSAQLAVLSFQHRSNTIPPLHNYCTASF